MDEKMDFSIGIKIFSIGAIKILDEKVDFLYRELDEHQLVWNAFFFLRQSSSLNQMIKWVKKGGTGSENDEKEKTKACLEKWFNSSNIVCTTPNFTFIWAI